MALLIWLTKISYYYEFPLQQTFICIVFNIFYRISEIDDKIKINILVLQVFIPPALRLIMYKVKLLKVLLFFLLVADILT
jgi:hypothetical protein